MDDEAKMAFYSEAANNHRHYSTCSLTVRLGAITEGLLLLTACGYAAVTANLGRFLPLLALLGLTFTTLLFLLHWAYLKAAESFAKSAMRIEGTYHGDGHPYSAYWHVRGERFKNPFVGFVTVHSTFVVLWIAFTFCILFSYFGK